MRKVWKRPRRRSWMKLRSPLPVLESIFQSWTQTFICQLFCKVFSGLGDGWHPGSVKQVANREAPPRKKLRGPTGDWGAGQERQVEAVFNARVKRHPTNSRLP